MKHLLLSALTALSFAMMPAHAGEQPVLVELYTSQGCSSCPPADAYLHKLAEREDVIALALHVDYWDYIGWKDSFASPQYTQRQRDYAGAAGRTMVYTPQMIINGGDHVVGNRPKDVEMLIEQSRTKAETIGMVAEKSGEGVAISLQPGEGAPARYVIYLAEYSPRESVDITRGENAGRTLSYANVVTRLKEVGGWDGAAPVKMGMDLTPGASAVVIVQQAGPGRVVAASYVR